VLNYFVLPNAALLLQADQTNRAAARDDMVVLEIGPGKHKYRIHKALLTHHSEYFQKALTGPWKEATERSVALDDVKPHIFDIFVQWIYTGKLPASRNEWRKLRMDSGAIPKPLDDDLFVTAMVEAYVFGDRFLADVFRRAVNNYIVDFVVKDGEDHPSWFYALNLAYSNLPEDNGLLDFLIELHSRLWYGGHYGNAKEGTILYQLPTRLLLKLLSRYATDATMSLNELKDPLKACDYHEHSSEEERALCEQEQE
jgi:hypothetical protein